MSPSLTDNKSFGHFFCTVIYFPPLWNVSEALLEKKEKKENRTECFLLSTVVTGAVRFYCCLCHKRNVFSSYRIIKSLYRGYNVKLVKLAL